MYVGCLWSVASKKVEKCILSKICHSKFLPPILIFVCFLKKKVSVYLHGVGGKVKEERTERERGSQKKGNWYVPKIHIHTHTNPAI